MLRNYLKVAGRSLVRNKVYTLINLINLTLALDVATVLFWIVRFDYTRADQPGRAVAAGLVCRKKSCPVPYSACPLSDV